jgi:hypothetical protein
MGTKLTGQPLQATPVVSVTRKVNGSFLGVLQDKGKQVKLRRGNAIVYTFLVKETDFDTQIRKDDAYVNCDVAEDEKVSIFAPKVLNDALQLASIGDVIRIEYLGKKPGRNGDYHNFDVEKI